MFNVIKERYITVIEGTPVENTYWYTFRRKHYVSQGIHYRCYVLTMLVQADNVLHQLL
jgi:hypothetical protein